MLSDSPNLFRPGDNFKIRAPAKAVAIGDSAVRVLADASEITGPPRDNFEVHEITREEFKKLRQ
jgi:hypothetical protein